MCNQELNTYNGRPFYIYVNEMVEAVSNITLCFCIYLFNLEFIEH